MPLRLTILLLALGLVAAPQTTPPPAHRLPARETLSYSVEWRLITAGKARLEWQHQTPESQVNLHLESVGLVSKLYKVDDRYTSNLTESLCAQSSQITSLEGSRERETKITFDGAAGRASYLEKDKSKNTVVSQREIKIPSCVHDVAGGLFFLRTLSLEPGQSVMVPVSDGKKSVMAKVEAQAREEIKTNLGAFHTVRYEAYLFNDVLYRRPAHLNVWITDDARRLPVQIRVRMQFTIGTITLQLEKMDQTQPQAGGD